MSYRDGRGMDHYEQYEVVEVNVKGQGKFFWEKPAMCLRLRELNPVDGIEENFLYPMKPGFLFPILANLDFDKIVPSEDRTEVPSLKER